VSEKTLRCPNCGADVPFVSPGALVVVCEHCNWASWRSDVDLESIGEVSQPAPLASHFQRGTAGRYRGRSFTVRGQIQLDHGAGLWNEWLAEDAEGEWFWIAEAQGEIWVLEEVPSDGDPPPAEGEADLERWVETSEGQWLVAERGEGRVVTVAGQLPIDIRAGSRTLYADLQRGRRHVATLDFTRDPTELFVGQRIELAELELDPMTQPEHRPETVKGRRIDCSECGGPIEIVDPEHALRIGCPSCGALLEQDSDEVRAIATEKTSRAKPAIPLGTRGRLRGEQLTVLGCMERRVRAEGQWWPWREYLLRASDGRYRWLIESDGHWSFLHPLPYAAASDLIRLKRSGAPNFKHFTSGKAVVHWVLGEFYWQVNAGDEVRTSDFAAAAHGRSISTEITAKELQASEGVHVEPEEVAAAFEGTRLPRRSGVGMVQPNRARPRADWALYGVAVLALLALRVFFGITHADELVFPRTTFGPTPQVKEQETVQFSEPFEVSAARGNLRVELAVPGIQQGWVGLNGALVNMESGKVTTFATSAQYYSGVSGGERWSEGSGRGRTWLGSIPAGTYRLRLASTGWDKGLGMSYDLSVRSQVPRSMWLVLGLILLLPLPVIASVRWWSFEYQRWKNSDHPWGEG